VNREAVVLAGGTAALLLQVAHPAVAAGVAAHSDFRADPFGRLRRTLGASWAVAFGDADAAERAVRRINATPVLVHGVIPETGAPYQARDPRLLLWVHATLVDSALRMHDRFVRPLAPPEMDAYVRESATVARALGVPAHMIPPDAAALRAWMRDMLTSGEVQVSPTARRLAAAILYPTAFPPRWVWDAAHLASLSILPADIRRQYGLPWNRSRAAGMERVAAASRWLVPRLPDAWHHVPAARATQRSRAS
jgi:uncharacterized protein (DUF2236 family)